MPHYGLFSWEPFPLDPSTTEIILWCCSLFLKSAVIATYIAIVLLPFVSAYFDHRQRTRRSRALSDEESGPEKGEKANDAEDDKTPPLAPQPPQDQSGEMNDDLKSYADPCKTLDTAFTEHNLRHYPPCIEEGLKGTYSVPSISRRHSIPGATCPFKYEDPWQGLSDSGERLGEWNNGKREGLESDGLNLIDAQDPDEVNKKTRC